jgi:hypothetical protein
MASEDDVRELALALADTVEKPSLIEGDPEKLAESARIRGG